MADEIAQLGIEIDSSGVDEARLSLDNLAEAATRAEASATSLARSQTQAMQAGVRQQQAQESFAKSASAAAAATEKQQQELSKLLGQIDPVVAALERLDQQEEKLRSFRGTGALDADTFNQFKATIDRNRDALGVFDDSLTRIGNTGKQTAQAIRQLPAQFSDIFISLQAGQSPLQVFLQQGAQIKDSFGGVGAALRETGRFALGLVNPFTVAAVAVGSLALAYQQGSQEAVEFNKAIILTGNSAGTSAGELSDLARAVGEVTGTQGAAAAALTQLTQTAGISRDQFELLATAAVSFQEATGQAVDESIKQYKRLADDPVKAVQELNESLNFLTPSIFENIVALQRQGDQAGATRVALEALANSQIERAAQVTENLGLLETAWNGITSAAKTAWDAMLDVGRAETPEQELERLRTTLEDIQRTGGTSGRARGLGINQDSEDNIRARITQLEEEQNTRDENARREGENAERNRTEIARIAAEEERRKKAAEEFGRIVESNLTKQQRLEKEIADIRRAGSEAGIDPAQIDAQVRAVEKRFAETTRKPRGTADPAVRDDAATRILLGLREQESALSLQLSTNEKLTAAEKERAKFIQQIADLQNKEVLTAEQKSLLANQDAIKAQLDKNVALESEIRLRNDSLRLQERSEQLSQTIAAANESRAAQNRDILGTFGLGRQEREVVESFGRIRKEFARYRQELDEATPEDLLGSDQYQDAVREIERGLADALEAQRKYYDELKTLQADAAKGAKESLADYVTEAQDLAGQTRDLTKSILGGIEDSFVELATTGKTSFRDLADSILADIARIGVRSLISNAIIGAGFGPKGAQQQGIDFGGILSSIGGLFGGGGASTYKGAFNFEGGGYTGSGSRSGGLDGRGGFLAMVHPNETVIDHTKQSANSSSGGNSNSIVINGLSLPGVTNARDGKRAAATIAREVNSLVVGSVRFA